MLRAWFTSKVAEWNQQIWDNDEFQNCWKTEMIELSILKTASVNALPNRKTNIPKRKSKSLPIFHLGYFGFNADRIHSPFNQLNSAS